MQVLCMFIPFIYALFLPFIKKWGKGHLGYYVLPIPIFLTVYYSSFIGKGTQYEAMTWVSALQLNIDSQLDGLSLLFSLLISGIGIFVLFYSIFYLNKKERLHQFYMYLLMFMTGMLGVVQADSVISLYVFWEVTSFASFLLIGYYYEDCISKDGAFKSLMITIFGGLMMLGGFLVLSNMTNTMSIREMIAQASQMEHSTMFYVALVLILLGAFTKSAQVPFYIWLPDAMAAPTPVSAYLHSATMVKAGIYIVARFTPIFSTTAVWGNTIAFVGVVTLCWGSFFAVKQKDLKGILAFSTVSQLGMIMAMLGVAGLVSYTNDTSTFYQFVAFAALFHLINHATFKGALFMMAGVLDHETGTRDIRKLGGLLSVMPISFTVTLLGTLSMAGVPPLNGFLSKELFFTTMWQSKEALSFGTVVFVSIWLASVFTFIYSLYFVCGTFLGKRQTLPKKPHEAPIALLLAPIALIVIGLFIAFRPNVVADLLIKRAVVAIQPALFPSAQQVNIDIALWHGFSAEFLWTLGVIGLGIIGVATLKKWQPLYDKWPSTWTLNALFDRFVQTGNTSLTTWSRRMMTGKSRQYFTFMLLMVSGLMLVTLWQKGAFVFSMDDASPVHLFDLVLVIALVAATIIVLKATTRMTAIIALGVVGYSVALFFVRFQAPDLALTQLVIETVSVALFLLVFRNLPKRIREKEKQKGKWLRVLIAASVGITVMLFAMASYSQKLLPTISSYYKETVLKEAGGGNIVNVILVDYRGFDTLFEITVLAIAGLAIVGLIRSKKRKGERQDESK